MRVVAENEETAHEEGSPRKKGWQGGGAQNFVIGGKDNREKTSG